MKKKRWRERDREEERERKRERERERKGRRALMGTIRTRRRDTMSTRRTNHISLPMIIMHISNI